MVESYQKEIASLKRNLEIEKASRLSLNVKRPVYSPGRYSEVDVKDFSSKRSANSDTENVQDISSMQVKGDNVGRFPTLVPYLETLRKLREDAGLKPD